MEITRNASTCLSGIAILGVVLSHVVFQNSLLGELLGRAGVILFLMMSGYGLAKSYGMDKLDLKRYAWKRFDRVVVPYWTVLSLTILRLIYQTGIPMPDFVVFMNYFFLVFIPYDIITDAWFVPYILLWYAVYAVACHLPASREQKVWALFAVPVVLFLASTPIVAYMASTYLNFNPLAFHYLYIPYAFCFPLGVYAALLDKTQVKIDFDNRPLHLIGDYAYWIYLLHVPVIHGLIAQGLIGRW